MSIKDFVLSEYDKFENMKKTNETTIDLLKSIVEVNSKLSLSENAYNTEHYRKLLNKLDSLNKDYYNHAKANLPELFIKYSNLFDMIVVNGVKRTTLSDVLTKFEQFKAGKISEYDAVSSGIDFSTTEYNLPKGFLSKNQVYDFIKNNKGKKDD